MVFVGGRSGRRTGHPSRLTSRGRRTGRQGLSVAGTGVDKGTAGETGGLTEPGWAEPQGAAAASLLGRAQPTGLARPAVQDSSGVLGAHPSGRGHRDACLAAPVLHQRQLLVCQVLPGGGAAGHAAAAEPLGGATPTQRAQHATTEAAGEDRGRHGAVSTVHAGGAPYTPAVRRGSEAGLLAATACGGGRRAHLACSLHSCRRRALLSPPTARRPNGRLLVALHPRQYPRPPAASALRPISPRGRRRA